MPTAEKQASVLPSLAKNVTAIPSMDKKHTTIPSNGFSVQYEETWHDGQKLRPGVWLHSTWDSKLGEQSTHEWICGPLEVEAITRSLQSTDYGRLISFINLDGQERKWAMPNLLLAGKSDSILGTLLTMGLDVSYEHRTKVTDVYRWSAPFSSRDCRNSRQAGMATSCSSCRARISVRARRFTRVKTPRRTTTVSEGRCMAGKAALAACALAILCCC